MRLRISIRGRVRPSVRLSFFFGFISHLIVPISSSDHQGKNRAEETLLRDLAAALRLVIITAKNRFTGDVFSIAEALKSIWDGAKLLIGTWKMEVKAGFGSGSGGDVDVGNWLLAKGGF